MKNHVYIFYFIIGLSILTSCKRNRLNINTSDINIKLEVTRFDQELFNIPTKSLEFDSDLEQLRNANPDFFDLFTYRMIQIGGIEDSMFFNEMNLFLNDSMIIDIETLVENEFGNFSATLKEITQAFKYYRYHFREKEIPNIYTCISGFNQSVVVAENLIGVSLDKYLGDECLYYEMLAIPQYKQQKMYKKRLPVDMMYAWAKSDFVKSNNESNLLSHMIYEGKLLYFIDAMFPKMHDTIKIGYTAKQLDWCKKNEAQMWTVLVENRRLYTSGRMDIKRIIDESPFTNGFPPESPGRAGVWIGWQIVRKFMEKYPHVTLPQLMNLNDSQKILNDSKYYPE